MSYQIFYHAEQAQAEYVILSSGLGGHASFWQAQIACLQQYFHVIVYDQKGCHAQSVLLDQSYTMTDMALQVLDILHEQNIQSCHFIGHALGALIGIELAVLMQQQGMKLLSLIAINAWDVPDAHTLKCFQTRIQLLKYAGCEAYVQAQALFLYPPAWISKHHEHIRLQEQKQLEDFPPISNVLTRIRALSQFKVGQSHYEALMQTDLHYLVNQDDFLVPYQKSDDLKHTLGHGRIQTFLQGGHASTVTETIQMNHAILDCLMPVVI